MSMRISNMQYIAIEMQNGCHSAISLCLIMASVSVILVLAVLVNSVNFEQDKPQNLMSYSKNSKTKFYIIS